MANFIALIVSIVGFAITWTCLMRLLFYYKGAHDEVHLVSTEDGFLVTLYHYLPGKCGDMYSLRVPTFSSTSRPPVLLCHGLGSNYFCYDPGPLPGFARYLSDKGFDVWAIDLRGRGTGGRIQQRRGEKPRGGWTFDDYVRYDLPAVIKYVCRETGHKQVNWVGHSMGGMVIYAYLQTQDASLICSATAIASPSTFRYYKWLKPVAPQAMALNKTMSHLRFMPVAAFVALLGYIAPLRRFGTNWNTYPWFAVNGVANPSTAVLSQFLEWIRNETFRNVDHSYVYKDGYPKITTPFLALVGRGDWIAPPPDVKYGIERMSSADKKFVYFSKKNGARCDYDHVTILISDAARQEVWPVIYDWLGNHSG